MPMKNTTMKGFTLVELIVAVGLFALVMTLATGAYLLMISLNRQAQSIATGINNLSFVLETMTRTIRTGTGYSCSSTVNLAECPSGGTSFTFEDTTNANLPTTFTFTGTKIQKTVNSVSSDLTDSSVITIDSSIGASKFIVTGTAVGDALQPHVIIVVKGTVPGKTPQTFTIETGATMRGTDI